MKKINWNQCLELRDLSRSLQRGRFAVKDISVIFVWWILFFLIFRFFDARFTINHPDFGDFFGDSQINGCVYFVSVFLGPVQGNFWVMRFVRRGTPKIGKKKVALASPARIHVDEMDVCEIPIGRDDTGRSAVWLLYREWPYRRKKGRQKCAKTREIDIWPKK